MVLKDINDVIINQIKTTLLNNKLIINIISRLTNFPNYLRHNNLIFFKRNRVYIFDQKNLH